MIRQSKQSIRGVLISFLLLLTLYYLSRQQQRLRPVQFTGGGNTNSNAKGQNGAAGDVAFPSSALVQFWDRLLEAMLTAAPQVSPITSPGMGDELFDPNAAAIQVARRPDLILLAPHDVDRLKTAHAGFRTAMAPIAPALPYVPNTRGIVTTAGGKYIGMAITSLLMLRRTGSQLPVEVFLDSRDSYSRGLCEQAMPQLNARCVVMEDLLAKTPAVPRMEKFQFKVLAILFSSFHEVLFLDADAFPIHNPDQLFNAEPFTSHGLVTWGDFWLPTISPLFFDITGMPQPGARTAKQRSSESGIMLYDKAKHADSLLLATYYNFYGPKYYYPLLSQGATGQGDKETFLQSALVLGNPAYRVETPIGIIGRHMSGKFKPCAMRQADPEEDYLIYLESQRREKQEQPSEDEETGERRPAARLMFVHHNLVKLDIRHMKDSLAPLFEKEDGHYRRLWGPANNIVNLAGYDVEKVMWEEILRANCGTSYVAGCEELREYYDSVFVES